MIQKQQNDVLGHPLPISTYLLKPFQRILKYPELLKVPKGFMIQIVTSRLALRAVTDCYRALRTA